MKLALLLYVCGVAGSVCLQVICDSLQLYTTCTTVAIMGELRSSYVYLCTKSLHNKLSYVATKYLVIEKAIHLLTGPHLVISHLNICDRISENLPSTHK